MFEEKDFFKDRTGYSKDYWKMHYAGLAMQGMLFDPKHHKEGFIKLCVDQSIQVANLLVENMQNEVLK
jgi:hypothetical protein